MRLVHSGGALGLACALGIGQPADSQVVRPGVRTGLLSAGIGVHAEAPRAAVVLPALVASGAPRSFQVMLVNLPAGLPSDSTVIAEVVTTGGFTALAPARREIAASHTRRSFAVTVAIPGAAPAGRLPAGEVRLLVGGRHRMTIPLVIEVFEVHRIVLEVAERPLVVLAGERARVTYAIANEGNLPEKVDLVLALPKGWSSESVTHDGLMIRAGGKHVGAITFTVPATSATGSFFLEAFLRGGDSKPLDTGRIAIVVIDPGHSATGGPRLATTFATASETTGAGEAFDFTLKGPITDGIRIDAHFSRAPSVSAASSLALSRLGIQQGSGYAQFFSASTRVGLGTAGTSLSELTGKYLAGKGAVVETTRRAWSLTAFTAQSETIDSAATRGLMLGARTEFRAGSVRVSQSMAHLRERVENGRQLDAIGLGVASELPHSSLLTAEVARRSYREGGGLGWAGSIERDDSRNRARLSITHAPGGSDAFARATDEITGEMSQRLTRRASIALAGWRVSDPTRLFARVASEGWSFRPEYALRPSLRMAVEVGGYGFSAAHRNPSAAMLGFGTSERRIGGSLGGSAKALHFNSSVTRSSVTRTLSTLGEGMASDRTSRLVWHGLTSWSTRRGTVQIRGNVEEAQDRFGAVRRQTTIGVRADQLQLPHLRQDIRLSAEAEALGGYGPARRALARVAMTMPAGTNFQLKLSAEHNPFMRSHSGAGRWVVAAGIEHALRLPMVRPPHSSGHVYQDLNGNEMRDPGEPGVAEVVVRRGAGAGVTREDGSYRIVGVAKGPLALDMGSIPEGWTIGKIGDREIALLPVSAADVELVIASRSGIDSVHLDLAPARVIARDGAGREWIARMTGSTTATFEALPHGDYELDFDFSEIAEPLVPRSPVARLTVTGRARSRAVVVLDPRQLKLWTPKVRPSAVSQPGASK